jgi:peptide/nickel transport system substrate-binding protein
VRFCTARGPYNCDMDEHDLLDLIARVKHGRLSRRAFVRAMIAAGLTTPLANQMLDHASVARAETTSQYKPTRRGGGGALRLLWWEAPTLLNPHFAVGFKDSEACRIFYEPLAGWDADANLVPVLATEIPDIANGGLARDGLSVTWRLKPDVRWHDGVPLTADDLVFNWEYASDPATATITGGIYGKIKVEKVDALTVRILFAKPTPHWADAFVGSRGKIIPKHLFEAYRGNKSREAPANLKPVGTGPYRFVSFTPGDLIRGELNRSYHRENRPHFDTIELKGGGDAVSAARAVLQTGEYDYAWNVLVEDDILKRLETGGRGRVVTAQANAVEHIKLNNSDPWTEVDGERSSAKTKNPLLSDPAVRRALTLLVDRQAVQDHIYGRLGTATGNFLNYPVRYRSPNTTWEFNVDKANQVLDAGGWTRGPDGIRAKGGRKLNLVFQTSTDAARQNVQAIVKHACQKANIGMELKSIAPSIYFSSDVANPDTVSKFYADLQMFTLASAPDPASFMLQFVSWEIASKANKWQGRNATRWKNSEYDRLYEAADSELDPVKRAALFIRMNDLVCNDAVVIPIVSRPKVAAASNRLHAPVSGWDDSLGSLADWYREE